MVGLVWWFDLDIIQLICYRVSDTKVEMVDHHQILKKLKYFTALSSPMCRGWCWGGWAQPSSRRATSWRGSLRSLSSQSSANSWFPFSHQFQTYIWADFSGLHEKVSKNVFTWSPGRAASLSTMETTSPLTRGSPPVNRIWKLKFLNNLTFKNVLENHPPPPLPPESRIFELALME